MSLGRAPDRQAAEWRRHVSPELVEASKLVCPGSFSGSEEVNFPINVPEDQRDALGFCLRERDALQKEVNGLPSNLRTEARSLRLRLMRSERGLGICFAIHIVRCTEVAQRHVAVVGKRNPPGKFRRSSCGPLWRAPAVNSCWSGSSAMLGDRVQLEHNS